jgi:predicted HicB family RNase H-like nuclease
VARNKDNLKRLTIETSKELHNEVRSRALICGLSIKQYVEQAIAEKMMREKQYE